MLRLSGSLLGGFPTMSLTPTVERRSARPYAAIRDLLPRERLAEVAPERVAAVYEWLGAHDLAPTGPPFVRYLVVDYNDGTVEVEVGVPTTSAATSGHEVQAGTLPSGRYAIVVHRGSYAELASTTAGLLAWGETNDAAWAMEETNRVTSWLGRIEHYVTGPADTPDESEWRTEIAIMLSGS